MWHLTAKKSWTYANVQGKSQRFQKRPKETSQRQEYKRGKRPSVMQKVIGGKDPIKKIIGGKDPIRKKVI